MESIVLSSSLNCSVSNAFRMWTEPELLAFFFGESQHVELRKGGAYEIYFSMAMPEGERGSEGCTLIDFTKNECLSFTWNAPPSIPSVRNSGNYTKVEVKFKPISKDSCELILSHDGWIYEGEDWEETHRYFQKAWPFVLNQLVEAVNKLKSS